MPGAVDCPLPCPFADDAETPCAAIALAVGLKDGGPHPFCRSAHPGMPASVRKITLQGLGRWVEPEPPALEVPAPEPALPPFWRQVITYLRSTARHLLAGAPSAAEALVAARLAVCEGTATTLRCDRYRPSDGKCSGCGCTANAKSVRALDACPLGRWPA